MTPHIRFPDTTNKNRKCTDLLFLLLILASWVVLLVIGVDAYSKGDVNGLLYGRDYAGRTCGFAHYSDSIANSESASLSFPRVINNVLTQESDSLPTFFYYVDMVGNGVCLTGCPSSDNFSPTAVNQLICKDFVDSASTTTSPLELVYSSKCIFQYDTFPFLTWCIPKSLTALTSMMNLNAQSFDETVTPANLGYDSVTTGEGVAEKFAEDLYTARWTILFSGIGGASIFGFIFFFFLSIPLVVGLFSWLAVLSLPVLFVGIGMACWWARDQIMEDAKLLDPVPAAGKSDYWQNRALIITSYTLYALAGLFVLLVCFLRKRIVLAIQVTKASASSIVTMPLMVLYPFIQLLGWLIFVGVWTFCLFVLAATGDLVPGNLEVYGFNIPYNYYVYSDEAKRSFWYLLFVYLWTCEFTRAIGQVTLSMAFSKWYFAPDKDLSKPGVQKDIGNRAFLETIFSAMYFHTGTAAFGSLLIAIVQFLRAIFSYIQKKMHSMDANGGLVKAISCCCCCCLWCFEKFLQFINKNAYVQTAIFGSAFCAAAMDAFSLVMRNAARILAVEFVSSFMFFLMRIWVVSASVFLSSYLLEYYYGSTLNSVYGLYVLVAFLGWIVAGLFSNVLEMGVATVIQCFVVDEECQIGLDEIERHCPANLIKCFSNVAEGVEEGMKEEIKRKRDRFSVGAGRNMEMADEDVTVAEIRERENLERENKLRLKEEKKGKKKKRKGKEKGERRVVTGLEEEGYFD